MSWQADPFDTHEGFREEGEWHSGIELAAFHVLPIFDGLEDDDILEDKRPGWPGSTTLFGFIHCTDSESIISSLDTHVNTAGESSWVFPKIVPFPST